MEWYNSNMDNKVEYLSITTVARRLGVGYNTVSRWLKKGIIKGYKFGKIWRIKESDLEEMKNK